MEEVEVERRALVGVLRELDEDDWRRPTQCAGWSVHHVLAHLVTPFLVPAPAMALLTVRHRGVSGAMQAAAERLVARDPADLLQVLEDSAASTFRPPALPAAAPLTDVVAHSADVRWALTEDRQDWGDPGRLRPVLDFLTSRRAAAGFVPPARLAGLRLEATDVEWECGRGDTVRGPALAVALAALGREGARRLVDGPGAPVLAARC